MVDRNKFKALPGDEIIVFSKPRSKEPVPIKCKVTEINETKIHAEGRYYNHWLTFESYTRNWVLAEEVSESNA